MSHTPKYCEPQACRLFERQLERLNTTEGLLHAAIAIAMHALDDIEPKRVVAELTSMGERVSRKVRGRQPQARLAHLHDLLFDELAFMGNMDDFFTPLNSYLPAVLATRRGSPILLCLIYKAVAEQLELPVEGLALPGHFVVRVGTGRDAMIIDPFFFGTLRTAEEVVRPWNPLLVVGRISPESVLRVATHTEWLAGILANLEHVFEANDCYHDLSAMVELHDLLCRAQV